MYMGKHTPIFILFLAAFLSACGTVTPLPPAEPPVSPAPATAPVELPTTTAAPEVLPTSVSGGGYPAGALQARVDLAGRLKLPVEQIQISAITPKDWPDTCLGLPAAGEACGQIILPGYLVTLTAGASEYQYRTDADGKIVRPVETPAQSAAGERSRSLFEWTGPGCEQFAVSSQAAFYGKCGESLQVVPGFDPGQEPFKYWIKTFAPFQAATPAGKIKFTGLDLHGAGVGKTTAEPADQRMLAEWARLQFEAAQAGRTGAAWGLVFAYHREGGIAGFCDDAGVYLDGRVLVSNCKGLNASFYLTTSELAQMYAWYDGYKSVDYQYSDPAVADKMTIVLNMPGVGQKTADEAEIRAMLAFISELDLRAAAMRQTKPDLADAEQALLEYFRALNSGDFAKGAQLYGGPTDLLKTWNPDIKNDLPAWLERGCKQNGLMCLLPRSIRYKGSDVRGGYQFLVEFNLANGRLFTQGPCCGEPAGPGESEFVFSVFAHGSAWQVMDLPPYVP